MRRREFLAGLVGGAAALALPVAWVRAAVPPGAEPRRLVVIFLRGAIDGLNVVVPYRDPAYYRGRPTLAIPAPGREGGAFDLDGRFGLHPALEAVLPFWKDKTLAFVHASGSPDPTRSHFDAQDYMEGGEPGNKKTQDGWMNRLIGALPDRISPVKAVNADIALPRILRGGRPVATVALGSATPKAAGGDSGQDVFERLYAGDAALAQAYREGAAARRRIQEDFAKEMAAADGGAVPARNFAGSALELGRLIHADPEIRLAFLSVGGWDTHVNQGGVAGPMAKKLGALGEGLARLVEGLGNSYPQTVVALMSEFGRTVRENGSQGTDHGHGNVMWLLGGRVDGGKVWGRWPGLDDEDLYEARDLAVTTDFRAVLDAVLRQHLGLAPAQLATVFPGFAPPADAGLTLLRT